jgi:ribosome maturation factor RimP
MAASDSMAIEKIRELAEPAAKALKLELVHIEIAGTRSRKIVRIYIDKPGGVSIEDCADMSQQMDASLDSVDLFAGPYVLEVSSPGLDRELYSIGDFVRFAGRQAKVRMKPDFQSAKAFIGKIEAVEGDEIIFHDRQAGTIRIPYSGIAKANLKVDLEEEFSRTGRT